MGRALIVGIVVGITVTIGIVMIFFRSDSAATIDDASSLVAALSVPSSSAQYGLFDDNTVVQGKTTLLFFASDDPFSAASEAYLHKVYGSGAAKVSAYRLEFGSSTGARLTHGVLVPNTFVLLDASGQRVTAVIHPSQEELSILLRGNIPVPPKQ